MSTTAGNSGDSNEAQSLLNPYDPGLDHGPSAFNAAHQFRANLSYELPFGHGKALLGGVHGVADKLISGWQVNTIVSLVSGFPLTPQVGANYSGNGDLNDPDRPSWNPAFSGNVIEGTPNQWFNPKAFTLPTPGTFGNVGRGSLVGPSLADVDFSTFKSTHLSERVALQFRAELFNIFNHVNFGNINELVFTGTTISPSARVVTTTATTSRQIQFGLKLIF
jgi:hypothetical protein